MNSSMPLFQKNDCGSDTSGESKDLITYIFSAHFTENPTWGLTYPLLGLLCPHTKCAIPQHTSEHFHGYCMINPFNIKKQVCWQVGSFGLPVAFCGTLQQSWRPSQSPLTGDRLRHIQSTRRAGLDEAAGAGTESPGEEKHQHSTHNCEQKC